MTCDDTSPFSPLLLLHKAGSYSKDAIHAIFQDLKIRSPSTGNELTEPFQFNLMFQTK
jgi:glycyl-tRNA synthetase (class II)